MRIAVPVSQGRFSEHFGGAEEFAIYTVDPAGAAISGRTTGVPPKHGRGVFPSWLHRHGVTVVIAGGMGPRAAGLLGRYGIEVVLGVEGENPDHLARAYLEGNLVATGAACHDHGFHDCGGPHGHP